MRKFKLYLCNILRRILFFLEPKNLIRLEALKIYLELNILTLFYSRRPQLTVIEPEQGNFRSVTFELKYRDNDFLKFKLERYTDGDLRYTFVGTNISDLRILNDTISTLVNGLNTNLHNIRGFFII